MGRKRKENRENVRDDRLKTVPKSKRPISKTVRKDYGFTPSQTKLFRTVVNFLNDFQQGYPVDTHLVMMLCHWWKVYEDMHEKIKSEGMVQQFKTGATNVTGYFSAYDKASNKVIDIMAKLGMSPAARARIVGFMVDGDGVDEHDPIADEFKK